MPTPPPALALLEFDSIAAGIAAGDAMVKRAPVDRLLSGTIQPGRYIVLVAGAVADVEEAYAAGEARGGDALQDRLLLPDVHPAVVAAIGGARPAVPEEALGIVETRAVAAAIRAADAGVKGAEVVLWQLRLGDGLGGKGLVLFAGAVGDVTAAVEIGRAAAAGHLLGDEIIAQLHDEMRVNVAANGRFGAHYADWPGA